jgi:Ni/Co efflux regulator RcnB
MGMQRISTQTICALVLVFSGMLTAGPVLAEKPSWAGDGKSKKHQHEMQQEQNRGATVETGIHFNDQQHTVVRDYFASQSRAGRCPPGLAKKNNGCMPPGQAKKWAVGQALPEDVSYHSLSSKVVVQLGTPPAGHRYVRVAADILLIAVGTGMVVDAIEDLGRK